jgi:hypothetical protein
MAQRVSISFKENAAEIISAAGKTRLGRVQRAEIGANLPNTPIEELGSDKLVGRIFDVPEISVTISAIDVGARTSFVMAGVDWATAASGTYIEAQDMKYVAVAQPFKSVASDDIARTLFVPGAKLERFALNYSVGGDATEEYGFQGTSSRWLRYDVTVASGVTSGGQLTGFSGARVLKNGSYVLCAFAGDGIGYLPEEAITASTATTVTFDTDTVPDGTPVVVAIHKDLTDQWDYTYEFPNVSPESAVPNQPVGVRGWGIEIFLVKSGETNEKIYRAQTCNIQAQYQTTRIQELGNEAVVGYSDGIPDVTGTLEIMLHDFKLGELLSGDEAGDNWTPTELGAGNWGLLVKVWRRNANRTTTEPEKAVWLPYLDITQEQNSAQVGQDARQTFNFSSRTNEVYIFKGDKPAGFWAA